MIGKDGEGDIELMGGPPVPPIRENLAQCDYLLKHVGLELITYWNLKEHNTARTTS